MDNFDNKENNNNINYDDFGATNPYQVLVNTIKNPFEFKQVNKQYEVEEQQQQEILSEQVNIENSPKFFKFEKNYLLLKLLLSLFIFLVSVSGLLLIVVNNYFTHSITNFINNGYYVLDALLLIPSICALISTSINFHFINKEYKNSLQNFDSNYVSNIIQKIYKRIFITNINLNWFIVYIVLTALFIILLVFIITYFKGLWEFGGRYAPSFGNIDPNVWFKINIISNVDFGIFPELNKITLISVCTIVGFLFLYQIVILFMNSIRLKRIETTYTTNILSEDEIIAIKHAANKRNFIIFCILTIFFGLILLLVYFLLKRKK